jgi:integrase
VPSKLVATVGKTHIWRSLRTSDRQEAAKRARIVVGDIQRSFGDSPAAARPYAWPVQSTGLTLEQAFDRFLADPARTRSVKTVSHYANLRVVTRGLWGEDRTMASVGRDDCRRLLDVLRVLPPNVAKRHRGKRFAQIVELAEAGRAGPPMNPATVNGYLSKFRAVLNYAQNEGWVDRNPARGLRVIDPVRARDKRDPFSSQQLRLIFDAPIFRGCQDDKDGYAVPGPARPRRARFWIPLLALFAGLRMNEACQLEVGDVVLIDGVWCLSISSASATGSSKKLKSDASERWVPIHPVLRAIGFVEFAEDVRAGGRARLFGELNPGSSGYLSDPYSKWFRRFLAKAGASEPRTCFHSFRHCFRDALREAGIRHDVGIALGGWASADSSDPEAAYGRGFSMGVLHEAVSRISYPVCLDHLISEDGHVPRPAVGEEGSRSSSDTQGGIGPIVNQLCEPVLRG